MAKKKTKKQQERAELRRIRRIDKALAEFYIKCEEDDSYLDECLNSNMRERFLDIIYNIGNFLRKFKKNKEEEVSDEEMANLTELAYETRNCKPGEIVMPVEVKLTKPMTKAELVKEIDRKTTEFYIKCEEDDSYLDVV